MHEPAEHAETVREAYQTYLQGRGGRPARNVSTRLQPDSAGEDTLAGMRGPYLQALPIANWSDRDWQTFARSQPLHPNITRAFHQEGFRRLYDFQERSVERILDGDDTVISAATGRGKTEAWLIPILDQIVRAKGSNSEDRTSTKALLMYPTKALAQDQFKRLVQILYRINRNLRQKEWVTIGIYDGDTPRHIYEEKAQGYLNKTFQHFDCPGANDDLAKCQSCGQGVFVERSTSGFRLRPDKPACEDDQPHHVPLDFVRLTRTEIMENGADIILTNPDTVNYRLFNINAEQEQQAFIYEPEFLVFDEVHTYDGLLGSYTATLVKRLRRLRARRDCDSLQVIGSSATVENDEELFRQISGADTVASVTEQPRELTSTPPDSIPNSLLDTRIETDTITESGRRSSGPPVQLGDVDLPLEDADQLDNDRLRDQLSEELFDYYTQENSDDPVVQTFQSLHRELASDPRTPQQFVSDCATQFDLSETAAERLIENFQTIGQYAGLLESRHHLFSWPLDGFYACAGCDAVYRSPQDECEVCESEFVTRATYCRTCGDEYLVANACSRCDQLLPYIHTEEGATGGNEFRTCPHCESGGEAVTMHRVTFRPHQECIDCGATEPRSVTAVCEECDSEVPGVPTGDGQLVCRNPECETTWDAGTACNECNSEAFRPATIDTPINCPSCAATHSASDLPTECSCGTPIRNNRLVPWTCADNSCEEVYFTAIPPESCECNSTGDFVKAGLYEVATAYHCQSCGHERLAGGSCNCTDPVYNTQERPYRRYRTWNPDRTVRSPLECKGSIPCDHGLSSSVVGDAYDELMRSPTNVAVTTSQYLLRDILNDGELSDAKLLGFSDSHRDMKDLDRAFTEPEVDTVLDQVVLAGLELAAAGQSADELDNGVLSDLEPGSITERFTESPMEWVSLDEVVEEGYTLLRALEEELGGDDVRESMGLSLAETILGTSYISDPKEVLQSRLRRRAIRHVGERPYEGRISLETDGLLDVRLAPDIDLSASEERVISALIEEGNNAEITDIDVEIPEGRQSIVDQLTLNDILCYRDGDRIALNPDIVELALPANGAIQYDPQSDTYYSQLRSRFTAGGDTVTSTDSLAERSSAEHPRFSERAFTTTRSRVAILLSRLYYGATPKMERRETEHLFREGSYPNFLSSGPTMEMGVDIGSLDTLLLYGTPPNMNAYLQRIGRAGRSSGSSLVHSVSQRNPIDYYYYDEPTELITAEKQPVPLNEHNERVLRISLAWGVLDYIASEFVIPWKSTQHNVSGGENAMRRATASEEERSEAAKFTKLLASTVSTLDLGSEESRLRSLGWTITDHESEIREFLGEILQYAYCDRCSRRANEAAAGDECQDPDCDGKFVSAFEEYGHLIDDAISTASEVFVNGYRNYAERLRDRIQQYETRQTELKEKREAASESEQERLDREIEQLSERIGVLRRYLNQLSGESFRTVLQDAFTEYAFNLRTVSDSVGIEVVDESGEPERIGDDRSGRSGRLALGELHPGAAYLHERRPYVVGQTVIDEKGSADLRETVEKHAETALADIGYLAGEFVCTACGNTTTDSETSCKCGSKSWQKRSLFSLDSVEATLETEPFPNGHDAAQSVYERSEKVQSTFAQRETEILDFTPDQQFELVTTDGTSIGTLALGDYEILEYTDSFRAKYQSGRVDEEETEFELCAEPDCTGIVYEGESGTRRCSVNSDHVIDGGDAEAVYARLGYSYGTEGVRVELDDDDSAAAHAFAHGIRLALQKLSGVTIRDVNEYIGTNHADIFDSLEGGAAVSRLLVEERDGEYRNFRSAVSLIETQFDCDCADGCPRCLYQYGCVTRNQPQSFDRETISAFVANDLQLQELSE